MLSHSALPMLLLLLLLCMQQDSCCCITPTCCVVQSTERLPMVLLLLLAAAVTGCTALPRLQPFACLLLMLQLLLGSPALVPEGVAQKFFNIACSTDRPASQSLQTSH